MRVRGVDFVALGLVGLAACGGGGEGPDSGYVLLDADARDAGYALEVAGDRVAAVLPVALGVDADAALVGPSGRVVLSAAGGELLSVEGADAALVTRGIGDEVDDGVLYVDAPTDAARSLAAALDGALTQGEDGWFEIRGEQLLQAAATTEPAADLRAVKPALRARPALALSPVETPRAPVQVASRTARQAPAARPSSVSVADIAALVARVGASVVEAIDAVLDARHAAPAVACKDPVAGTWLTQIYDENYREWYVFTLHIGRAGNGRLAGRIDSHWWVGDSEAVRAPASCGDDGAQHFEVGMTAEGTFVGDELRFGGTSHRVERRHCGGDFGYNLDQFSGKFDGSHFFAVNNDGGKAIDQPAPFRRVSCR